MILYIGTYISTNNAIYQLEIDDSTYDLVSQNMIESGPHPSFMTFNKNRDKLYCVNEMYEQVDGVLGTVCELSKEGDTFHLANKLSTGGNHPCHVCLSKDEKLLFVTNYTSGGLRIFQLDEDGKISDELEALQFHGSSVHIERQKSSHVHQTVLSECGNFLFMTDLGCDKIHIFEINTNNPSGVLTEIGVIQTPSGTAPRHMCWDKEHDFFYVSAEISSSVLVYKYNAGTLSFLQELKLFPNMKTPYPYTSCAEIAFHQGYVYVANRGDDSLSICKQQKEDGTLTLIKHVKTGGNTPRHFIVFDSTKHSLNIDSALLIVGNQDSDSLALFTVQEGDLKLIKIIECIEKPVCIAK